MLLLNRIFSIWTVQSTEDDMIPAEWWSVSVSGAVRKPLSTRGNIGLLLVGRTGSSATTYTQWHLPALWLAGTCSQQLHGTKIICMGSSNSSFTTESCACAFIAFLAGISWCVDSMEVQNIRTTGNWFGERRIIVEALLRSYFMAVCKGMHWMGWDQMWRTCLQYYQRRQTVRPWVGLIVWSKKRPLRDITIHQSLKYATSVYSTFTSNSSNVNMLQ